MALSAPSLAIFDVDGTLIDSQNIIIAAMSQAIRSHGAPPVQASAIRDIIGLSVIEAVQTLLPNHEATDHARIANLYKTAFNDLVKLPEHDEPLFPGSLEILDWLNDQGWILGLATGKSRRGVA